MYGGFSYRLETLGVRATLISESWCRVVERSAELGRWAACLRQYGGYFSVMSSEQKAAVPNDVRRRLARQAADAALAAVDPAAIQHQVSLIGHN
jgi:hypothetical protein